MRKPELVINKLAGYSGIRLKNHKPLVFKPGLNLLVGRNGCGKTNLLWLIQALATGKVDLKDRIESSFLMKHAQSCINKKGSNPEAKFGVITIVEHSINGKTGGIEAALKNVPASYVLNNLMKDSSNFSGHVELKCETFPVKFRQVHSTLNAPKFEMSGFVSSNFLSREMNNDVHSIMGGPIKVVSDFIRAKMNEFYEGDEFKNMIHQLESTINRNFARFLGTTSKTVKINISEISESGRASLSLMDNGNYIRSIDMSSGEAILLNLIFSLAIARVEGCEVLNLDEPDVYMHDDMIHVLVEELSDFSKHLPDCIITVASHSTALIERLAALGHDKVNIITFDNERNVGNSKGDLDLINALNRNGVWFSPLMLSKKQNVFIENQLKGGKDHRDFLLKFFPSDNRPNIIPIGTSGNVQDSSSFTGVFEEILKVSNVSSIGIQDGDIWFKGHLRRYLKSDLTLESFIKLLKKQKGTYIEGEGNQANCYYFNFWEIENLYMAEELLSCWKTPKGKYLSSEAYKQALDKKREAISAEYFDTFYKSILRIVPNKNGTPKKTQEFLKGKFTAIESDLSDVAGLEVRMRSLVDSILRQNLIHWVPGKEIKKSLENDGFTFDTDGVDFESLKISGLLRKLPMPKQRITR
jgi:AAA15 family ATPase/GTPase